MIIERTVRELRKQLNRWRASGDRIALVPTMGNLHKGHLKLVEKARELAERVAVTIFVNPLQFGAGEDLENYPSTLEEDRANLIDRGTDLLFNPDVSEVYTRSRNEETLVEVPGVSDILCGESRPGHFIGVTTVVCKLFNMAQPDVAVFGEKDFQQLMLIRRMVEDLYLPVEIFGVATVREFDGLAMSSRNSYLAPDERHKAPALYRTLQRTAHRINADDTELKLLEDLALTELGEAGFRPDYFKIRRASDLQSPRPSDRELVILAAAYLGKARLIDNLTLTRSV